MTSRRISFELVQDQETKGDRPTGDNSREVGASKDPMRWLGAPETDQSSDGRFRRQVADLYREVMAEHSPEKMSGSARTLSSNGMDRPQRRDGPRGARVDASLDGPVDPRLRGRCDVSRGTPFLLLEAAGHLLKLWGAAHGWPPPRLARDLVLLEVVRSGGGTPRQLALRLHISRSTVAGIVREGVREGLFDRSPHLDRRTVWVAPTRWGIQRASKIAGRWRATDAALLGVLRVEERDDLRVALRGWCALQAVDLDP